MENKETIKWRSKQQKHDYPDAASYLSPILGERAAENAARDLDSAEMSKLPTKDIFRESRDKRNDKVIIADGYHRLCAVYTFDENAMIPCKIAGPD